MTKEEKVKEVLKRLHKVYPKPKTALEFKDPFQLLIATILSAQTTDKTVNLITPNLFKKYPSPKAFASENLPDIEKAISKVNFYRNKAKSIKEASKIIDEKYKGKVPDNMEELDALPGVARKTANVVLTNGYGKNEGIVVDTHVMRLSMKLGLTDKKDPEKIEEDLMKVVPKDQWGNFSNMLIHFGRDYCPAKPHECRSCPLNELCPDN